MAHASGKYAKAISDRSGLEFPYKEMVKEWNGLTVHKSEFESKHPQLERTRKSADRISLKNVKPSRIEPVTVIVLVPVIISVKSPFTVSRLSDKYVSFVIPTILVSLVPVIILFKLPVIVSCKLFLIIIFLLPVITSL